MTDSAATSGRPLSGRAVLFALLGFFVVVAAVNGVFIALALRSHPGVADENAYQDGLTYNETLTAAEAQRALGWQVSLAATDGPQGEIVLSARDRAGKPVAAAEARLLLRHPGDRSADREAAMIADGPGRWRLPAGDLARGNWDVQALIARPDAEPYRADWRIWLKTEGAP